jgi:protein MAK11
MRLKLTCCLDLCIRSVKALSPLYPLLASVSSDGFVNLYDLSQLPARTAGAAAVPELAPVSQYDTKKTRLTCVTMAEGGALAVGEDGQEADESSSEEELDENEDDDDVAFDSDEELSGEDGMVEQEEEDEDEAEYE